MIQDFVPIPGDMYDVSPALSNPFEYRLASGVWVWASMCVVWMSMRECVGVCRCLCVWVWVSMCVGVGVYVYECGYLCVGV